jgi:uncharacterized DUF497 family protein
MGFEWDEKKNQSNQRKHGLNFADAEQVFAGRTLTFEDSREAHSEPRFVTVGSLAWPAGSSSSRTRRAAMPLGSFR